MLLLLRAAAAGRGRPAGRRLVAARGSVAERTGQLGGDPLERAAERLRFLRFLL
jgi:hypothetical protein